MTQKEAGRTAGSSCTVLCSDCFLLFTRSFHYCSVVLRKLCPEISMSLKGPSCQHAAVKVAHLVVPSFTHPETIFCSVPCSASYSSIGFHQGIQRPGVIFADWGDDGGGRLGNCFMFMAEVFVGSDRMPV